MQNADIAPVLIAGAPARSRVVGGLRDAICQGLLTPGSRLNERELCESYDVYAPSFAKGCATRGQGFVTIETNRGAVVAGIFYTDAETCSRFAERWSRWPAHYLRAEARSNTSAPWPRPPRAPRRP